MTLRPTGDADNDGTTDWVEAERGDAPFGGEASTLTAVVTGQYERDTESSEFSRNPLVLMGFTISIGASLLVLAVLVTASLLRRVTDRVPSVLEHRSVLRYTVLTVLLIVGFIIWVGFS